MFTWFDCFVIMNLCLLIYCCGVCLYVFCLLLLFGLGFVCANCVGYFTQVVLRLLFWVDLTCVVCCLCWFTRGFLFDLLPECLLFRFELIFAVCACVLVCLFTVDTLFYFCWVELYLL